MQMTAKQMLYLLEQKKKTIYNKIQKKKEIKNKIKACNGLHISNYRQVFII